MDCVRENVEDRDARGMGDGKLSNMLLLWLICFPIGMLFSCVVYKFLGLQNEWDDLL